MDQRMDSSVSMTTDRSVLGYQVSVTEVSEADNNDYYEHFLPLLALIDSRGELKEKHEKLQRKKKELLDCEESLKHLELNKEGLESERESWLEKIKEATNELKRIEDSINDCDEVTKSLLTTRTEAIDEIKRTEDFLKEYVESTKDLFKQLELEPKDENIKLIDYMLKSIEEKEAELACPVCLEIAEAPIFMCQQMHLICASCQPKVTSCPECREDYQGPPRRHRYAERDSEELKKMKEELAKMTS